ncbi:YeeE/YedE thiosulfate transporter family protein [Methanopyrus sp. SNP6]|uniref:YeeE/YedE thiosulfate transporter family protein n=1 Tax=Methanopyrus sp. SNP6 TaxID=1937005 RepID=UPI0011E5DD5C|nr:YeeE/YedE thiosulfate transporter family protein [Methanopyrus sp. SNP6]
MAEYLHAIGTLAFGVLIGYLGQRSAMCFIGGIRDVYLLRDTWLVQGLIGFLIGAFFGLSVFGAAGMIKKFPWFLYKGASAIPGDVLGKKPGFVAHAAVTVVGGLGVGFLSVVQGGCPFRNYVMAAEGNVTAMAYLLGMFVGAVFYHACIIPIFGPPK